MILMKIYLKNLISINQKIRNPNNCYNEVFYLSEKCMTHVP